MNENYGGKANSLVKLKFNGFNVPEFFVISSLDYKNFLKKNDLLNQIEELLKKEKYNDIKALILNSQISEELEKKIKENFLKLNTNFVSVRSSFINEDGKERAFAGQFSTYLDVSYDKLIESIKLCWSSLYDENVILYSGETNIDGMNVIVQKMVYSDFSGVAFSIDPSSDTKNYSFIEVVKGVGESLVSGKVTPSKFLVRRETKNIDLKIGESFLEDYLVVELENIILNIEKLYEFPVDVEFAIKDKKIFILQARPITAFAPIEKMFSLNLCRPNNLIEESIYYMGEFEGIKNVTRGLYYFKPLFVYNKENNNTSIYYNCIDLEEDPRLMYYYMDLDYEKVKEQYNYVKEKVKILDDIIDCNKDIDVNTFISDLISIYPFISLGQLAGHYDVISERLRKILYDFRLNYDYIIHKACDYFLKFVKNSLPLEYKEYINYITLKEFISNCLPDMSELALRKNGYIFYGDIFTTSNYVEWLKENNIVFEEESDEALFKGQVIFGGNVQGKVCKVFNENDFSKFCEGDILVTPMTTPKFMKVIKKASAIITDEGGVTCHAAIISRELKITCVVGCKNITKALSDGDIVKINGSNGKITIIN